MTDGRQDIERVLSYHEITKHHPHRYARSAGYLDWATQPDPFRTYAGAVRIELPLAADGLDTRYDDLYEVGVVAPRLLTLESIGAFFELALGLTAWKEHRGSRWALRSDPSSGNLHPTEGYLVTRGWPELAAGVYHYVSRDHCVERRCRLEPEPTQRLRRCLPEGSFLFGITSIHWREAWKYGERAFRYCQHDAGHVIATARFAAAALGWSARLLPGFGDASVSALLGLNRDGDFAAVDACEREHPDAVLLVAPANVASAAQHIDGASTELADLIAAGAWSGTANPLSSGHVDWEILEVVAKASRKPTTSDPARAGPVPVRRTRGSASESLAATIIRQRRSAVALDGATSLPREVFYAMLERVLAADGAPFDVLPWPPKLHLGIFVHRVDGLRPGLYLLERGLDVHDAFKAQLGSKALWQKPEGCPEAMRLFCIGENDYRKTAASVSCGQDIAADGAFSLGMIAEFRGTIETGSFWYRRLFWESGVIGQVLYLEAEAAGIRGTGIGCYFDDLFHEVVGIEGDSFQSLYHFTVGGPVEDGRLVTHPAYAHLAESRRATAGQRPRRG